MSPPRWAPWLLLIVSVLAFAVGHVLMLAAGLAKMPHDFWPDLLIAAAFLCFALVGAPVAARHPTNAVGWVMLAIGLVYQVRAVGVGYVAAAVLLDRQPTVPPAATAWLANIWIVSFLLLAILGVVFPAGRLPSPRWRAFLWLAGLIAIVGILTSWFEVGGRTFTFPGIDRLRATPLGDEVVDTFGALAQFGLLALGLTSVRALVRRLRAAAGPVRQQLKWIVYALAAMVIVLAVETIIFALPLRQQIDPNAPYPAGIWLGLPIGLAIALPPISAGIAILRYRLYDIDLLINRTLVYGALSATLAALYAGLVIALQGVLSGFTGGEGLAVAVSTLAVAALFQPFRRRMQRAVDRRFYRSRYDAQRTLEAFSARLRDEVDLIRLTDELRDVVESTVQPAGVSVWLRQRTP